MKSGKRARRRWDPVERELRTTEGPMIAGVDEVGRGPLAGPVVACAVIMPPAARAIAGVDDSKRLTAPQRLRLARIIRQRAVAVGLGAASAREIDRLNIYHATTLAIRRALGRLSAAPHHVLIDGKRIRSLAVPHTAIVGGDARCYSIACASIIAKVTRDRVMKALAKRYPTYGWERNVGYTTAKHLAGLAAAGVTPHHRRSFVPVYQLALELADTVPAADVAETADVPAVVIDPGAALDLAVDLVAPPETAPYATEAP
ncbi:MAG: ribonuclease HII [Gemmatimonadaceae bacterium]